MAGMRSLFALLVGICLILAASANQQTYIVHLDKIIVEPEQSYNAIIDSIVEMEVAEPQGMSTARPELLYVYENALSGFAVKLGIKQLNSLKKVNGVLSVTSDELLNLHTTHSPEFLGLKAGEGLWSSSNLASDVIVGVLDTGIWPEHVAFHDSGMPPVPSRWKGVCEAGPNFSSASCNKKLIGARSFFKGYEAVAGRINETADYRSARDRQGHGTHTASTAAGDLVKKASLFGLAKGMAAGMRYSSRIAAYKVCWQFGCASSDILAAIDQAVADGVDVLSLSLGGLARPFYSDNIAIASFGAVQRGVFVTCSAGNSGPSSSTVSNAAPWIMTVAASYMDRRFPSKIDLGNGQSFEGSSLYSGTRTSRLPLVYNMTAGMDKGAAYCLTDSLSPDLVKGKIVVCERGINSRTAKGEQVKLAGGQGMILLNSDDQGEELTADAHILPATLVGTAAANAIRKYLNTSKNPKASISFHGTSFGNIAPIMAAFSSRGPSRFGPEIIKPDITAPGVNILAAWPPIVGPSLLKSDNRSVPFNIISGTSMSCPHVSGLAGLLKSVHRYWSSAAIKSALMTTSYVIDNRRALMEDFGSSSGLADPFAYVSGHVDPEKASDPGLIYDISTEDYLKYLCSLYGTSPQVDVFAKTNYTCPSKKGVTQPGDLNYPSFAVLVNRTAQKLSFRYKRTLTNVGDGPITYQAQVTEPVGASVKVNPDTLVFSKSGEKMSYKVRFIASGKSPNAMNSSFGAITWISGSGRYIVRSPIAVTWL